MNKLFSKIAAASVGLAMAVGVGVVVGGHASAVRADEEAAMQAGANSSSVTVNGNNAIKCGAGSKAGSMTITVGSGATSLSFYAGGWNNDTGRVVNITAPSGVTLSESSITLENESVFAGTATSFTVADESIHLRTITLSGVTAETAITLTANVASKNRFVVWGATYDAGGGGGGGDTYKVTFNGNGTTNRPVADVPSTISGLEDGAVQTLTGSPTRWGYSFKGWGATADATETISSVTIDGADVTVYALWDEDHTAHGAWSDAPYSVAEVRAAIDVDKSKTLPSVYVTGIISQVTEFKSSYKSITYWISDDGTKTNEFEAYSGKGLNGADFAAITDIEVGATVVLCGDAKFYSSGSVYEYNFDNYMISYEAPSTGDIDVTFEPSECLPVGNSGTFTASTTAANPSYSFSSDNPSILSVASNGAYTAESAGKANVTVNVTSDDGEGHKTVEIEVVEVKTVSEAVTIAAALDSGATTSYRVKLTGFVSSLDADGKARAVNVTDGSEVIEIFFGGGNADYTTVTGAAFIGSKLSVYAKIQNYSGTYETTNNILIGVDAGDANSYAAGAYKNLDKVCETGVSAVTADQWTALAAGFNALDAAEQEKFRAEDVSVYGQNVVNWVNRYGIIVSNSSLSNFMALTSVQSMYVPGSDNDSAKAIIIIIAATFALTTFGAILLIRKKKHN